ATRQPAEQDDGAACADELRCVAPAGFGSRRLDRDVGVLAVARLRAELARERASLFASADDDGTAACIRDARAEHQSDRPGAEDGDGIRPFATTCAPLRLTAVTNGAAQRFSYSRIAAFVPGSIAAPASS